MTLYVAHSSIEKIQVCFYTVVVRNESLAQLFRGGLKAFVARYRAECNNQISVFCDMGSSEFDDVIQDLIANGLKRDDDFALFDAADLALSESISMGRFKRPKMINLGLSWLKVQYTPGGMFVWYAGKG